MAMAERHLHGEHLLLFHRFQLVYLRNSMENILNFVDVDDDLINMLSIILCPGLCSTYR